MSHPVPAPRTNPPDVKKPIPTPRKITKPKPETEEHTNTFSRRVRSLSNASRQIAEDLGELVQDKKKAVIAGTRQSVRRITKRFNSYHSESPQVKKTKIFSSHKFNLILPRIRSLKKMILVIQLTYSTQ